MKKSDLELYTDYVLSTFGATTARGLSAMVDGEVSHDRITRFLSDREYTSKDLWLRAKTVAREVGDSDGVLIFDDTIRDKAWTDERVDMLALRPLQRPYSQGTQPAQRAVPPRRQVYPRGV